MLLAALCMTSAAAQRPGDRLLVCNKSAGTLSVFDAVDHREIATLRIGGRPHEVAVSADGRTAVVTDYGAGRAGSSITVLDVARGERTRTIELQLAHADGDGEARFSRPHGVQFASPSEVLVTSEATGHVVLVDVAAGRVQRATPTGQRSSHLVAASPEFGYALISCPVDGTVVRLDLLAAAGAEDHRSIRVGGGAEGIALHPRSGDLWVAVRDEDALVVVSPQTLAVTARLDTGRLPLRVAFTPDGARALVTCTKSGELMIFDAATRSVVGEVSIHGDRSEASSLPLAVVSDPDARRAYVTCARGEFVAVVDLASAELVGRIDARAGPDGVAYARPLPLPAADQRPRRKTP